MNSEDACGSIGLSEHEIDLILQAATLDGPISEFQARKIIDWAARTLADHTVLRLILKGRIKVSDIKHLVEETCEFDISLRK